MDRTQRISETKRWFFEKINKSLAKLIQRKKRSLKLLKSEMKSKSSQHTAMKFRKSKDDETFRRKYRRKIFRT